MQVASPELYGAASRAGSFRHIRLGTQANAEVAAMITRHVRLVVTQALLLARDRFHPL